MIEIFQTNKNEMYLVKTSKEVNEINPSKIYTETATSNYGVIIK